MSGKQSILDTKVHVYTIRVYDKWYLEYIIRFNLCGYEFDRQTMEILTNFKMGIHSWKKSINWFVFNQINSQKIEMDQNMKLILIFALGWQIFLDMPLSLFAKQFLNLFDECWGIRCQATKFKNNTVQQLWWYLSTGQKSERQSGNMCVAAMSLLPTVFLCGMQRAVVNEKE